MLRSLISSPFIPSSGLSYLAKYPVSVVIDKLSTRCRLSRRHETVGRLADRVARQRLARELTELVGPAISSRDQIVRIRRLNVNLTLTAREFDEETLAAAWARALAKSLFEALAHGGSSGSFQLVRASSMAVFRATFLRDLLAGRAGGRWEYAEFDELLRLPVTEAALALLFSDPPNIVITLSALDGSPALERLVAQLDDLALERLFVAVVATGVASAVASLAPADLLWAAAQVLAASRLNAFALDSRRQALWIFVRTKGGEGRTPRAIFHTLLALACLLECPEILHHLDDTEAPAWPENVERRTGRRLPPSVSAVLLELRRVMGSSRTTGATPPNKLAGLLPLLDRLRPLVPTAAPQAFGGQSPWLEVESAGLLLLTAIVIRLGWAEFRDDTFLSRFGGPRFFQILMAGIGSAVLDPTSLEFHSLDPAAALFAGFEREPGLAGMRHSLATIDSAHRGQLLARLMPDAAIVTAAKDWPATLDALAEKLIGEFTSRIPGFRQASREAIVRQFLRKPGRVQMTEHLVSVLLASSPFHVALRISGMDDPVPSVSWMGNRQLEFRLLGT